MNKTAYPYEKKSNKIRLIKYIIYSIMSISTTLTMTMDLHTVSVSSSNRFVKFLAEFRESIHGFSIIWLILVLVFFNIYRSFFEKKNFVWKKEIFIVAFFFASWMLLGKSYSAVASWDLIFADWFQIFKSVILFTGYLSIFYIAVDLIFDFFHSGRIENLYPLSNILLKRISGEGSVIFPWLVILICWIPWLIISYPAILPWDTMNQIYQSAGIIELTNYHPILITYLFKLFLIIGKLFGSDNVGIFIFAAFQVLFFAYALSLSLKLMKMSSIPDKVRLIMLFFYCFVPYYPCNAVTLGKDTTYSIFLFVFTLINIYLIMNRAKIDHDSFLIHGMFLSALFCIFSRNNGIFVIIPSLAGLMLVLKQYRNKILIMILTLIILYSAFLFVILPKMNISQVKVQDVFSVPFQQTARYLKTYPSDITDQEAEAIDRILEYDKIAENYNPESSDPVKSLYRQNARADDFINYFHAWFTMFMRHPSVYIQATLNNTYGYFYPDEPGKSEDYVFWGIKSYLTTDKVDLFNPEKLNDARSILFQIIYTFRVFPGISMLSSIGFHVWLLILSLSYLIKIHQYHYIIGLIPSILSLFVCLLSPINTYSRYAWPIIFLTPLVIFICIPTCREPITEEE